MDIYMYHCIGGQMCIILSSVERVCKNNNSCCMLCVYRYRKFSCKYISKVYDEVPKYYLCTQ